jgi:tetratricopeptide (TPR) repeat protein
MLDLIGRIQTEAGDYERAGPLLEEALAIRRHTLGANHPDVATSLINTARLIGLRDGADARAIPLLREAHELRRRLFGRDDQRTMDALYALASALHMSGDYRSARPLFDEWSAGVSRQPPRLSPERAEQLATLSNIMQFSKQPARAESLARQALALDVRLYGPTHNRVAIMLSRLGAIVHDQGRSAEADSVLRASIAMLRRNHPDGHPAIAHALRDLASSLVSQERWAEADSVWRESAALYRRYMGEGSLGYANAVGWTGYIQLMRGHAPEAERTLRGALALRKTTGSRSDPITQRARLFLGQALQQEGRLREAEPLLLDGYAMAATVGLPRRVQIRAARSLVALYEAQGRTTEAAKYRDWASR